LKFAYVPSDGRALTPQCFTDASHYRTSSKQYWGFKDPVRGDGALMAGDAVGFEAVALVRELVRSVRVIPAPRGVVGLEIAWS
jgi:hypothetical protein